MGERRSIEALSDEALLSQVKQLVASSNELMADLLLHLAEVDVRRLYLGKAYASLFAYCVHELGFPEDAACQRIAVARAARQFPQLLEGLRSGRVHITALRLLAPHFTEANCNALLEEAAGKTKRAVEEMVARLAPQPPVADSIRKLPVAKPASEETSAQAETEQPASLLFETTAAPQPRPSPRLADTLAPLSEETFKVQFTASRGLRDKLRQAQDLAAGHPDLAEVVEKGIDLLLAQLKAKRFGATVAPRKTGADAVRTDKRYIPAGIRRAVYERDKGQCAFVDDTGRRCTEKRHLEFDHLHGFARTHAHSVEGLRLLCRAHNQHAADVLYGAEFTAAARDTGVRDGEMVWMGEVIRPGTDNGTSWVFGEQRTS